MAISADLVRTVVPILPIDTRAEISPGVTAELEKGVVAVFTDRSVTYDCPGCPDSELQLWKRACTWVSHEGADLFHEVMQFGFDETGELHLLAAFVDTDGAPHRAFLRSIESENTPAVGNISVATGPCTLIRFTADDDEDSGLLSAVTEWLEQHQDFVVVASQLGHDADGRPQYLLVLEGWEPESL